MVASWPFKGITHGKGTMGTRREPVGIYALFVIYLQTLAPAKQHEIQ
jgi:hypothetical protein